MTSHKQERGMKFGVYEGIAATIMSTIVSAFLGVYIVSLGGTNTDVGLALSIPALLAIVAYIPAAYIAERGVSRKKISVVTSLLSRMLWIPVAFVPLLFFGGTIPVLMVIMLATLSSFLGAFITPSWSSLMGDIVPAEERGRYFGSRNNKCILFSLVFVFLSGFIIDYLGSIQGFFFSFIMAGIAGILSSVFFMGFPDIRFPISEKINIKRDIEFILSDKKFKYFIISFSVFQFGVALASPFFNIYLVEYMNAPYIWISILILAGGITKIVFQKGWGSLSDRFGHLHILRITAVGATFIPLLWIFAPSPEFTVPIEILSGLSWAGLIVKDITF